MRRLMILIAAAAMLIACGKSDESWLGSTKTADDAQHPGSVGGTAVVPDASAGTTVVVLLEDGRIAVRETAIPPGPAVLTVTNGGDQLHNLFIEGPGVKKAAGDPLDANQSRAVTVELQEGTYTLYCPILDHREKGEVTTFTARR